MFFSKNAKNPKMFLAKYAKNPKMFRQMADQDLPRYRKRNVLAVQSHVEFAVAAEGEPIGGGGYQDMLFLNAGVPVEHVYVVGFARVAISADY